MQLLLVIKWWNRLMLFHLCNPINSRLETPSVLHCTRVCDIFVSTSDSLIGNIDIDTVTINGTILSFVDYLLFNRIVSVGCGINGTVRHRAASAGYVPVLSAHLGCRSRRRPGRLRGNPRQWDPLHHRLWRVASQRRRHCRTSLVSLFDFRFFIVCFFICWLIDLFITLS